MTNPTRNLLLNGPVTVPADFLGHHQCYPALGSVPTIAIGNNRTLDYLSGVGSTAIPTRWYGIETSAGNYTNWIDLDTLVTYCRTQGTTVTYQLIGTPAFYTSLTTNDSAGRAGGYAYPDLDTNLVATQAFITALITRYNTPGGVWATANPTLGKGIKCLMPVNEPQFQNATFSGIITGNTVLTVTAVTGTIKFDGTMFAQGAGVTGGGKITAFVSGTSGGPGVYTITSSANTGGIEPMVGIGTGSSNFWWGSYAQTVDFCNAVYLAAKAVDSTITVSSPAFTDMVKYAVPYLTSTGTIYSSIQGSQPFDVLDFHSYTCCPMGQPYATFCTDIVGGSGGIGDAQQVSAMYCGGKPLSMSEYGFDFGTDMVLTSFLNELPAVRETYLLRILFAAALMGVTRVNLFRMYSTLCGVWDAISGGTVDTNGVVAAWNLFNSLVPGHQFTQGSQIWGGAITGTRNDGLVVTF